MSYNNLCFSFTEYMLMVIRFRLEFLSTFTPPTLSSTSSGNWRSIGEETVTLSCISPTSADVAVCLQSGHASRILLFTINGYVIGTHEVEETITCMAMTNVPEGTGINCFAVGLVSGVIRFVCLSFYDCSPLLSECFLAIC